MKPILVGERHALPLRKLGFLTIPAGSASPSKEFFRGYIFNIAGEEVVKLLDQNEATGNYRVYWDGKNRNGEVVGNSVYFVLIQTPDGNMIRKTIVLK